jgi:hypothetical protein
MGYSKTEIDKIMDDFARQRDELKDWVRDAKPKASEEWWKLELKLEYLKRNLDAMRNGQDQIISAPLALAVDELRDGYARIRRMV